MNREKGSFQYNIRRTFVTYSIVPAVIVVSLAMFTFIICWILLISSSTRKNSEDIAAELSRTIGIYYELLDDVDVKLSRSGYEVDVADIYPILYDKTAEFGDIGNLIILSKDHEALFSAKGSVPTFLTAKEFENWGVWNCINKNGATPALILYEGNLCAVKGVFKGESLMAGLVYIIPGDVITKAAGVQDRHLYITDRNDFIYASNTSWLRDDYGRISSELSHKSGFIRPEKVLCYSSFSRTTGGLIVYSLDEIQQSLQLIWVLIGVIVVIFLAITRFTLKSTEDSSLKYTTDIKRIENAFEKVQNGDLDAKLSIDSSTEFKVIGDDFNEMLESLKDQIKRNNELAENAAFSQVKQLESQFNPHFLFNTLDNIRFMAKIDADAADKMIVSLSGLLRYSIKEIRDEVTVKEDLNNLQYYLNILQIRFNKRFAYSIDVSEDIYDCLIPKLLLQPLIENAVKYGFNGQEKLTVNIKGYQLGDRLIFICKDDGAGIEKAQLGKIVDNLTQDTNSSGHYGLYNIHRRIQLMYKGDYGLNISSKAGHGTTVRLTIPKHTE